MREIKIIEAAEHKVDSAQACCKDMPAFRLAKDAMLHSVRSN